MKEEKMMILSMLEEGKITSAEAIKLIEALEENEELEKWKEWEEDSESENANNTKIDIEKDNDKGKINADKNLSSDKDTKKEENSNSDIGNKVFNIINNIVDKTHFNINNSIFETVNKTLEKNISHLENPSLELWGMNGEIKISSWDKESVLLKTTFKLKKYFSGKNRDDELYSFTEKDNSIIFSPSSKQNVPIVGVKIEAYIPNRKFNKITLTTSNGKIEGEKIHADKFICRTSNSSIIFEKIDANKIKCKTDNSKIQMTDINSLSIDSATSNGSVTLTNINSSLTSSSTKNGKITFDNISSDKIIGTTSNGSINLNDIKSKTIKVNTSNGKITFDKIKTGNMESIELSTSNDSIEGSLNHISKPTSLDLETSLGTIALELENMVYRINKNSKLGPKKIIAHSIDFDESKDHLDILCRTSNGSIIIK